MITTDIEWANPIYTHEIGYKINRNTIYVNPISDIFTFGYFANSAFFNIL